jgi:hypothetical protein
MISFNAEIKGHFNASDSLPQSPQRSQRMFKIQRLSDILEISVISVGSVVKFLLSLGKGPCRTVSLCVKTSFLLESLADAEVELSKVVDTLAAIERESDI